MPDKSLTDFKFLTSETFREIFQSSSEGIIMVNREGQILIANPVAEKMFGYDPKALIGKPLEILLPSRFKSTHVDHRQKFNAQPQPRRMGVGRDLMAMRKDGSEFPVEVSLSHMTLNKQFVVMAFIIDITERKKAEEALKKSEEQLTIYAGELEKKVHSRTEALNKTVHDLEVANQEVKKALEREMELNELKSKFVSIASHEFRTPLSTILSSASLVKQYNERGEKDKIEKHVNRIKNSVSHLTGILNDFLSVSKLEEGKVIVSPESIRLDFYLNEIAEETWPILKTDQKITIKHNGYQKNIESDPKILRNILFNLLSNASKYSNEGKEIVIEVEYSKDNFTVHVHDEGMGIPQAEAKHLFERFFRASNSINIQGTGLGLNIVKRYIDLLNGSVTFSTEEGKGTTFTIQMPYQL